MHCHRYRTGILTVLAILVLAFHEVSSAPELDGGDRSMDLVRVQVHRNHFFVSAKIQEDFDGIKDELRRGLVLLDNLFTLRGSENDPRFWLVPNGYDLETVLREEFEIDADEIVRARNRGLFRYQRDVFLVTPSGTPRAQVARLIFQEQADHLINMVGPEDQIGWFHTGMAAYLSWYVQGAVFQVTTPRIEQDIIDYYTPLYNGNDALPLATLENEEDYRRAIQHRRQTIFAQSVLSYLVAARKSQPAFGVTVLRLLESGERFDEAFERASGMRLYDFEELLNKEFYPSLNESPPPEA